jgi:hypothetical protein
MRSVNSTEEMRFLRIAAAASKADAKSKSGAVEANPAAFDPVATAVASSISRLVMSAILAWSKLRSLGAQARSSDKYQRIACVFQRQRRERVGVSYAEDMKISFIESLQCSNPDEGVPVFYSRYCRDSVL